MLKELEKKLRDNHAAWTEDRLWDAFAVTEPARVTGRSQAGRFADDFDYSPFSQEGGLGRAYQLFGDQLPTLLEELNGVLVA